MSYEIEQPRGIYDVEEHYVPKTQGGEETQRDMVAAASAAGA